VSDTQTLTNKTLTNPTINGFTGNTAVVNIGSGQIYKDVSGNVGIGTSSPSTKLMISGASETTSAPTDAGTKASTLLVMGGSEGVGSGGTVAFGAFGDTFAAIKGSINDAANNGTGVLCFSTRNATTDTSLTERMRIDSSGNVGIGTSSPSAKLQVVGTGVYGIEIGAGVDGTAPTLYINGGSDGANGATILGRRNGNNEWFISSLRGIIGGGAQGLAHYIPGAHPMVFYTSATERMRIDSSGNVGIGTSSPARKLHVSDVMRLEPRNGAPSSPAKGDIYFDSADDKLKCYDGTNWQNLF
jgi:hypothetical protein